MNPVYLDHCATTPIHPEVESAMLETRERLTGNPSSVHAFGRRARGVMTEARSRMARQLGVAPADLVFTASGSEANNLAIKGVALRTWPAPLRLVISAIEHDSIRNAARYLADKFETLTLVEVPPNAEGRMDPSTIAEACPEDGACLIAVMALNNETGVIQPVEEIGALARDRKALFLCDAVQALGRLEVDTEAWKCDFLTASAHKICGPRGMGLLVAGRGAAFDPLVHGGHQEGGRRAGTERVEGMVGFAAALERVRGERANSQEKMRELESAFFVGLRSCEIAFTHNGAGAPRAPGVLNLAFAGIASHDLVVGMDLAGYAISAGSACSSGVIEPSHVLKAMGLERWQVEGGVRISFGESNTPAQAHEAGQALGNLAQRLRTEDAAFSAS